MDNFKDLYAEEQFIKIQDKLALGIDLTNKIKKCDIKLVSGIDLAYWNDNNEDYAVCSIVTIDYNTRKVIEMKHSFDTIKVPYIPGFLSFRELPLILKTYKLLEKKPHIAIFDGNGILHYRNMGIATHGSFYMNIPTIGVAKSYLKIYNVDFTMPEDKDGAFTDIVIKGKVCGRALRTHKGVKPIFVSSGNFIDLDTATDITLSLVNSESRQPLPTRIADIQTRKLREMLKEGETL